MQLQKDVVRALLRRLYGVQGERPPEQTGDVVMPTVDVGRLEASDLLFEQGIFSWWISISLAAVAGEFGGIVIQPGAGFPRRGIWTVDWLANAAALLTLVQIGATTAGLAGTGKVKYADNRVMPVAAGVGVPIDTFFGTDPATSGLGVYFLGATQHYGIGDWPGYVGDAETQNFSVWANAVNVVHTIALGGRFIP